MSTEYRDESEAVLSPCCDRGKLERACWSDGIFMELLRIQLQLGIAAKEGSIDRTLDLLFETSLRAFACVETLKDPLSIEARFNAKHLPK